MRASLWWSSAALVLSCGGSAGLPLTDFTPLINGATEATATTHWEGQVSFVSSRFGGTAPVQFAFYGDGTGKLSMGVGLCNSMPVNGGNGALPPEQPWIMQQQFKWSTTGADFALVTPIISATCPSPYSMYPSGTVYTVHSLKAPTGSVAGGTANVADDAGYAWSGQLRLGPVGNSCEPLNSACSSNAQCCSSVCLCSTGKCGTTTIICN